jgi:hypothetical protein
MPAADIVRVRWEVSALDPSGEALAWTISVYARNAEDAATEARHIASMLGYDHAPLVYVTML